MSRALAQHQPLQHALFSSNVWLVFVVTFFCSSLSYSSALAVAPCPVPSSTYPTIQTAVNDASCASIHVAAGIYYELVTLNRNVTIRGEGQENTVVDGAGRGPVFRINSGTVTIKNVTIRNGVRKSLNGGGIYNAEDQGGGIYNVFATLIVKNSTFYNNSALTGSGIFNVGGEVTIQNSIFSGNNTESTFFGHGGPGGGISSFGTLTVQNSIFADNSAGWDGGAIYTGPHIGEAVTLTHVTFQNNTPNDCAGCP